jgi:hypothetical protein
LALSQIFRDRPPPPPAKSCGKFTVEVWNAENLRENLGTLAKSFKSAERLPDATLIVNGHEVACDVVRIQNSDQRRLTPDYTFEKTIWIDRAHQTFLKTIEHAQAYIMSGAARIPMEEEITTTSRPLN